MTSWKSRLWHASPATVVDAVRKRLGRDTGTAPADGIEWFTVQSGPAAGARVRLDTPLGGAPRAIVSGTYEGFIYTRLQKRRSIEGAIVWDLGAHFGYHCLCFAALGARSIVAFEPHPANSARLLETMKGNPDLAHNVFHLPLAVSDVDGETTMLNGERLQGESSCSHVEGALAPLGKSGYEGFTRRMVETVRVDTLIEERQYAPPDVVKIDVEGAEGMVLRGGARFFASHSPVLFVEVHHILLMLEVQKLLGGWGYATEVIQEAGSSPSRCFIVAVRD